LTAAGSGTPVPTTEAPVDSLWWSGCAPVTLNAMAMIRIAAGECRVSVLGGEPVSGTKSQYST
jgi:hypothetical protein